jgi:outer membrane receptor protein involved in Fe transport
LTKILTQWRVTPRLTITPGLRYDINSGITEKDDRMTIYRPGAQSELLPNAPPGILVAGDPGVPSSLSKKANKLAPRFNVAYDLTGDGKTAVRGSAGLYYGRRAGHL